MTETGVGRQVLAYQVSLTLGDHAEDYDINGIVEWIIAWYGCVDIDEIPADEYTKLIEKFDTSLQ